MILAPSFVRPDDIMTYVDALEEHLDENGTIVFNWFEDTYIERASRTGNGRRLPQFVCTLWSVHERVLLQQEKTNNSAEAARQKLQHELGMYPPTILRKLYVTSILLGMSKKVDSSHKFFVTFGFINIGAINHSQPTYAQKSDHYFARSTRQLYSFDKRYSM